METRRFQIPVSRGDSYNVMNFGALGDGRTMDTKAIQAALDACRAQGAGIVRLPRGTYRSGALFMSANTTLLIEEGATLLGSDDLADYPMIDTRWEGTEEAASASLINARDADDLLLTGRGTIAGSGAGNSRSPAGPRVAEFIRCHRVLIENLTFTNKGRWTIHPIYCQHVVARNLNIITEGHNADGFNPDSSQFVWVHHCSFATGDDCIAIKSGKNQQAVDIGIPCAQILVEDCEMTRGHGGVVIGSEMSGGIRDVLVRNCRFATMDKGIRLKTRIGRGGAAQDIRYENITIDRVDAPIELDMQYTCNPGDLIPGEAGIPSFRNLVIRNVTILGQKGRSTIQGLPESPVQGAVLDHITMESKHPLVLRHVMDLHLKEVKNHRLPEPVSLDHVHVASRD